MHPFPHTRKKNPTEVGLYLFLNYLRLVYNPNKRTSTTVKVAPDTFAKISRISACLVVVNNSCAISIPIPKKTENRNEAIKGLKLFVSIVWLFKNKKQNDVSTK